MAGVLGELVAKHGGMPVSRPALREIPIRENAEAPEFFVGLEQGEFDVVLFETGVGVRYLVEANGNAISHAKIGPLSWPGSW